MASGDPRDEANQTQPDQQLDTSSLTINADHSTSAFLTSQYSLMQKQFEKAIAELDGHRRWAFDFEQVKAWLDLNPWVNIPRYQNNIGLWEIEYRPGTTITPAPIPKDKDYHLAPETPAKVFELFPKLAAELRTLIWDFNVSPRLVHLLPHCEPQLYYGLPAMMSQPLAFPKTEDCYKKVYFRANVPRVPALYTCTESREHAKNTYKMLFNTVDGPSGIYMDPAKDVLLLGYNCLNLLSTMFSDPITPLSHTLHADRRMIRRMMIPVEGAWWSDGWNCYQTDYHFTCNFTEKLPGTLAYFTGLEELFLVFTDTRRLWVENMSIMEMALTANTEGDAIPWTHHPDFPFRRNRQDLIEEMRYISRHFKNFHMPTVHVFTDLEHTLDEVGFVTTCTPEEILAEETDGQSVNP